jgi:hypothetical protein
VGVQYGYLQLVGFAIQIGLRKLGIKSKNQIKLGAICSEVVWFYLQRLDPDLFAKMDRDTVAPSDLYRVVTESGRFKLVQHKLYGDTVAKTAKV